MSGKKINLTKTGKLRVPKNPIIPFIEGDGIKPDIWASAVRGFDAAVEKVYGGKKSIGWHEILAGEKAFDNTKKWLPRKTLDDIKDYKGVPSPSVHPEKVDMIIFCENTEDIYVGIEFLHGIQLIEELEKFLGQGNES